MNSTSFLDVSQAEDFATFERRLVNMSEDLGFPLVNCVLTVLGSSPTEPLSVYGAGNTPEPYLESFSSIDLTARDPVMARLREQKFQAITYDQDFYVKAGASDLWEEQAAFGYRCGIAVSLDLPNNRRFALGIDRDKPLPQGPELTVLMAHLQLLAVHAQAAADRLLPLAQEAAALRVPLTPRELEIMRYTMDGKSSAVIAQLLNINIGTVNFHVQKFCRKLGVATRLQAALKAQSLKLI